MSFLGNNFPAANSYEQLSYGYDALGRRVVKDVAGESAEIMVYDDEDVVKAEAGGVVEKRFVHGAGIDDYVAMVRPDGLPEAGTYNYHADGLGSVTALSDNSDATLQASYEYRPFGDANELSGTGIEQFNPYGYTAREMDKETGLMFYRSRYFSPEQRRFVEEDRFRGFIQTPCTYINRYFYVKNNPINFFDPKGESWVKAIYWLLKKIAISVGKKLGIKGIDKLTDHSGELNRGEDEMIMHDHYHDIDQDGICNWYDNDMDGDGINNSEDNSPRGDMPYDIPWTDEIEGPHEPFWCPTFDTPDIDIHDMPIMQ